MRNGKWEMGNDKTEMSKLNTKDKREKRAEILLCDELDT